MPEENTRSRSLIERLQKLEREHRYLYRRAVRVNNEVGRINSNWTAQGERELPISSETRQLVFDLDQCAKHIGNMLTLARKGELR